jgi:hypothetical protein
MDKEIINISQPEKIKLEFGKNDIWIMPYISLKDGTKFITDYISIFFRDEHTQLANYILSEYALMLSIIDNLTSIEVYGENTEANVNIDSLIYSGLWESIKGNIKNYNQFRTDLNNVIKMMNEQRMLEKSVGGVLDDLSRRVVQFFDKVSDLDLSKEKVTELIDTIQAEAKKYDEKFNMTPAIPASAKNTRKKKEILQ